MNFQSYNDRNIDKHILRLPLSYLLLFSTTLSGGGGGGGLSPELEVYQQISTPWFDCSKLREHLVKEWHTIGLEFSQISQTMVVVEELVL